MNVLIWVYVYCKAYLNGDFNLHMGNDEELDGEEEFGQNWIIFGTIVISGDVLGNGFVETASVQLISMSCSCEK